ncbi:3-isopropylmalate dehydratase small subunit [Piscibacillus halophilus]|uniref:3-isopropylmalate dehydratase small subunit n=1 Tax=Piscibacillus halophilus TaxID=571933 RepID=A0A1H9I7Y6_9BACI|nr:3-isopropylmalate dehydratase small subunit [Piscibacillus halophilus]SEQ70811.1 3-isopropylmalate dehydratase, small subunit [Piscibacillus halophilus]
MQPFRNHLGKVVPIDKTDIDTDIIIPTEFLKRIERTGYDKHLMYYWRYDDQGRIKKDFPLNQPQYQGTTILLTGDNFGCGSSRENAVWALYDYGFRVILAPSFADIFKNNCTKNGLLPIELPQQDIQQLFHFTTLDILKLTIDLENQVITNHEDLNFSFDIDPHTKYKFINGLDDIDITLTAESSINRFEQERPFYMDPYN